MAKRKEQPAIVQKFGRKLRKLREAKDMTQEELAVKSGLHRTYISMLERGERSAALDSLEKIARSLGVSMQELIP